MKRRTIETLFTLLTLFATSIVTVATSKKDVETNNLSNNHEATRSYYVASNCSGAVPQSRVTIADRTIIEPANMRFYDFGLPITQLSVTSTQQFSAAMNGYQRTCVRSEQVDQGTLLTVYSCYENNQVVCQVSFELVQ